MDAGSWASFAGVFIALMETGSVSHAATRLGQHQPNVSKRLREAEERLGRKLFVRGRAGLEQTDFAKTLLPAIRKTLDDIEQLEALSRHLVNHHPRTELRVFSFPRCGETLVLPALASLGCDDPSVKIRFISHLRRDLSQQLALSETDAVIRTQRSDGNIEGTLIGSVPLVALMPSSHPLAGLQSLSVDQIGGHRIVQLEHGTLMREIADELFEAANVTPIVGAETNSSGVAAQMAQLGLGILIVDAIIPPKILDGPAVAIPLRCPVRIDVVVQTKLGLTTTENELVGRLEESLRNRMKGLATDSANSNRSDR